MSETDPEQPVEREPRFSREPSALKTTVYLFISVVFGFVYIAYLLNFTYTAPLFEGFANASTLGELLFPLLMIALYCLLWVPALLLIVFAGMCIFELAKKVMVRQKGN